MPVKKTDLGNGKFNVDITCDFCGLPITQTSRKFGMQCANKCSEKKFKEDMEKDPILKSLNDMLESIRPK